MFDFDMCCQTPACPPAEAVLPQMQVSVSDPRAMAELEKLEFDIRPISRPIVPFLIFAEEAQAQLAEGGAGGTSADWTPPDTDPATGHVTNFRGGGGGAADAPEQVQYRALSERISRHTRNRGYNGCTANAQLVYHSHTTRIQLTYHSGVLSAPLPLLAQEDP
eukprot:1179651-Prorocentrum_minimum.AAC.1